MLFQVIQNSTLNKNDSAKSSAASIAAAMIAMVSLISCAKNGGTSGQKVSIPLAPPPPPTADLPLSELDAGGCLNLEKLPTTMDAFPADTIVRDYTRDFTMEAKTTNDQDVRRNFASIAAFSQFAFADKSADLYGKYFGSIKQKGCESVEISNEIEGTAKYAVAVTGNSQEILLKRLHVDPVTGKEKPDGFEIDYLVKGPRELEIKTSREMMDPCPPWFTSRASSTESVRWGTSQEVDATPIEISRLYLKNVSVVVATMPTALMGLVVHESGDLVKTTATDLKDLRSATLDPGVLRCPFVGTNPEGANPPQPTPTPTPAATPTPTPGGPAAPGTSPVPGPSPASSPVPASNSAAH